MLTRKDGLHLTKEIKKAEKDLPIIFLKANSLDEDKITGLKTCCDDCVTTPFYIGKLLLRIKVVLNRKTKQEDEIDPKVISI